jgi:hypothetical protein
MTDRQTEIAKESLLLFFSKMKNWEEKYHKRHFVEKVPRELYAEEMKSELVSIFSSHVTDKERKTGRVKNPHAGFPPEFNPEREEFIGIENVKDSKIIFETLWKHPTVPTMTEKRRYTVLKQDGVWLLDKEEIFKKVKDKWENRVL